MKVYKRKLAGVEDLSKHPVKSTEDRPVRQLRVDYSVEAFWENAPDKFGFEAVNRRQHRVEYAGGFWREPSS